MVHVILVGIATFACSIALVALILHFSSVDDDVCLFSPLQSFLSCTASEMNIYSNMHGFCCILSKNLQCRADETIS